jgi:hypothetical protein
MGRIVGFQGTGDAFRPMTYEAGIARGIDLFPGNFLATSVTGFRLSARCSGSMGVVTRRCDRSRPSWPCCYEAWSSLATDREGAKGTSSA